MLEHFVFSSRIYFSSSLRWITIPYFRERFLFLCLSISLSFQAIVIILAFYNAVSGTAFEAKIHGQALSGNAEFLHLRGSGGFSLCKQKHSSSREVKMDVCPPAYIRRQCLLFVANYPQGICVLCELRRVFYNT